MRLVEPSLTHKEAYFDFVRDWDAHGEQITPYMARLLERTYEQWLDATEAIKTRPPEGFVCAHMFFCLGDADDIVGAIDIRHTLSDRLRSFGGHIGYGVRPAMRRRGYATAMLREGLAEARKLGIDRALVCCNLENEPSARTIERCGGVLENVVPVPGEDRMVKRYWIDIGRL